MNAWAYLHGGKIERCIENTANEAFKYRVLERADHLQFRQIASFLGESVGEVFEAFVARDVLGKASERSSRVLGALPRQSNVMAVEGAVSGGS